MKNDETKLPEIDLTKTLTIDWDALKASLDEYKMEKSALWPEIFDTKDLTGRSNVQLCADGLVAWGNCWAGHGVHPNFGEVMVKIGERLGIAPTGDNLMNWSDKWIDERKPHQN